MIEPKCHRVSITLVLSNTNKALLTRSFKCTSTRTSTSLLHYKHVTNIRNHNHKFKIFLKLFVQATKIYRSELGDDHPVTVGSLDLFAIIYADVGKKLYEGKIIDM